MKITCIFTCNFSETGLTMCQDFKNWQNVNVKCEGRQCTKYHVYNYSYILYSVNMHVIVPVLKYFATFGPVFMILDSVVPPQISIPQLNA